MINVRCFTNLDNYDCSRITRMVGIPNIGDTVSVEQRGSERWLKVTMIIHDMDGLTKEPFIRVELNR